MAYLSLGDCLATTNRYTEAEVVLKKCLTLDGSRVKDIRSHVTAKKSCVLRLGQMFMMIGKHQDAVKIFKSAIKSEESSSQVNDFQIFITTNFYLIIKARFKKLTIENSTFTIYKTNSCRIFKI